MRVTVLRAGLSDAHLVEHVGRGTLPDLPGVREFAEAHGLAVAPVEMSAYAVRELQKAGRAVSEDHASAPVLADQAEGPDDGDQRTAVAVQEAPAVTQQLVVEPPAVMPVYRSVNASATLLGSGLGTQTPVP